MPETSKRVLPNVIAGVGYLLTFGACIFGTAVTLAALGVAIAIDLVRGAMRGTLRQRLRKPRW